MTLSRTKILQSTRKSKAGAHLSGLKTRNKILETATAIATANSESQLARQRGNQHPRTQTDSYILNNASLSGQSYPFALHVSFFLSVPSFFFRHGRLNTSGVNQAKTDKGTGPGMERRWPSKPECSAVDGMTANMKTSCMKSIPRHKKAMQGHYYVYQNAQAER